MTSEEAIFFSGGTKLELPDIVYFEPREDITAYELALAVPILFRMMDCDWGWIDPRQMIPSLPEGVRRHFRLEPRS
jgi:hypothetical protein